MKKPIPFLFTILSFLPVFAHQDTTDSLYLKVRGFGIGLPQEKVYLHMDNTCYFIGDTIWYKGYVTRSDRNTLTDLSKILYVELLTPDGYLVERQQLEMPKGMAHGAFVLKDSLYAGYYELRAYTRWMLNFGQYEHPHTAWVEKAFYNTQMAKDFFRDYDKLYSRVFPVYDRPKEEGHFTKDMTVRPLRRYFKEKEEKPQPDLRFYPEGGNLVESTDCRVALELNDGDGQHIDSTGISITDKDGREVARCLTDERGRAVFALPEVTKEADYRAVFSCQGYDFEVELPEVEATGCALSVIQNDTAVVATLQVEGVGLPLALHVMCQGVSHFYRPLKMAQQQQTAPPERGAGPKGLRGLTPTRGNFNADAEAKPLSRYATAPLSGGAVAPSTGYPRIIQVAIPLDSLPTGVNQLTVFDGEGRIYADRLFFVNHHDYDTPRLAVSGIRAQYEPFDSITLHLRLTHPADSVAGLSLAVRDRSTEESSYDNGTMLTEMLLASEIRGFVENPGYYFEADDSLHRQALDCLLMVQGWRRYDWKEMAGVKEFTLSWPSETQQEIIGSVHRGYSLFQDNEPGELSFITTLMQKDLTLPIDFNTTEDCGWNYRGKSLQHLYGSLIPRLDKEANIFASFSQGKETLNLMTGTEKGKFRILSPKLYEDYILELTGTDANIEPTTTFSEKYSKGFNDETAEPLFFVKQDRFFPIFPKPYSYYQASLKFPIIIPDAAGDSLSFDNRLLPSVTVQARRGGLRRLDRSQPTVVLDAYEAFNLTADYGLNGGQHDWRTFSQQVAVALVADMNMERRYFIQEQYDGKPQNLKTNRSTDYKLRKDIGKSDIPDIGLNTPKETRYSQSGTILKRYRRLKYLNKLYIYTDYAPREEGSWRYSQGYQPEVIIDYRRFPDEGYQHTFRDRHYVLRGYAVCEDFYSPDYSRRPLPGTKDFRRTLLWMPEVRFDRNGEATVRLYNNGKATSLSIEAEGITAGGKFIQYKNMQP